MWLFLAFLIVPLIEIALFIQIGGLIGLWPTLAIVIATAVIGTMLVRSQGLATLSQLRGSMERFDDPSQPLFDGAMILFAGALLLTPGFFTDAVGFALLTPTVRRGLMSYLKRHVQFVQTGTGQGGPTYSYSRNPSASDDLIEGEYEEIDPDKSSGPGNSGWTRH